MTILAGFLGQYAGTVNVTGLWWVNRFMVKKKVSLRVRNFETSKLINLLAVLCSWRGSTPVLNAGSLYP